MNWTGVLRLSGSLLFLWACSVRVQAQVTFTGQVLNALTHSPVPYATVYINASTHGTTANAGGQYRLTDVPLGTVDIAASSVGFKTARQAIRVSAQRDRRVSFYLQPDESLQTVTVKAKRTAAANRMIRQFKQDLLGDPYFADKCLIVNLETVRLTLEDGRLEAHASEPLVIDNQALGYRLYFDMLHFDSFKRSTHYAGASRFEAMTPANAEQADRWERNRNRAYQGSIRHLMASLVAGNSEQEGFLVYKALFDAPADPAQRIMRLTFERPTEVMLADSLIRATALPSERHFYSPKPLEIFYTPRRYGASPYRDLPYAYTVIYTPKGPTTITTDGWVVQPNGMEVEGAMNEDRLATLLPIDWKPADSAKKSTTGNASDGTLLPADATLDSLVARWQNGQKIIAPSVFVQLDKSLYATGDHLWFSGYVLNPATYQPQLPPLPEPENPLHVELVAPNGHTVHHQWMPVTDGRMSGSFRLSDSLTSGLYRMRAYATADVNNARPAFERVVPIANGLAASTNAAFSSQAVFPDSVTVQCMPEGGRWVAGLPTRLGIRATDRQGWGVVISGTIRSSQGTDAGSFSTTAAGVGSLALTPQSNQSYVAVGSGGAGSFAVRLPPVEANGVVLTADLVTDSTQLVVQLQASATLAQQPLYVTVQSRGQLVLKTKIALRNGKARLSIATAKMPAGLAQVTLFNDQGQPQAQRLVFVPDHLLPVQAEVITDKKQYQPHETVQLSVRLLDGFDEPISMIGSASVTDAAQLPADTSGADIRTTILLTGELRERLEPIAGFRVANRRAIDNLLLTQTYRRTNWLFLVDEAGKPGLSQNGMVLTGRVLDRKNNAMPDVNVLLTFTDNTGQGFARTAHTDQQGHFSIDKLVFTDTVAVTSRVMNATFKSITTARVVFDPPGGLFALDDATLPVKLAGIAPYLNAMQNRQASQPLAYRDQAVRQLQEVVVRATKPDDDRQARRISLHGTPDYKVVFDRSARTFSNVYEMIRGRVPGVQVNQKQSGGGYNVVIRGAGFRGNSNPLYLVDGMYVNENSEGTELFMFNPADIERIEVLSGSSATIYGARGGAGVIALFSAHGDTDKPAAPDPVVAPSTMTGYLTNRVFSTPRYSTPPDSLPTPPDRRDVLYWRPLLATDGRGVTSFSFPLSDKARTIRLVLQGVTTYGQPVYVEKIITIQ